MTIQSKIMDKENRNWFDVLTEALGWVQIMLSPTLVGLVLGGLFYLYSSDLVGKIGGLVIATSGLVIGLIWATHAKKKHGTIWFLSRTMATPELDTKYDSTNDKHILQGSSGAKTSNGKR